ncbi:MAG: signal peptidase I [Ruminococcus sp.]|nr:signal peptidase I [Ruminococcus sp.]
MIENENKCNKVFDSIIDWLESFLFAIFIVILVFTFILRTVVVKGSSMEPNFHDKDRLIISHFNLTPEKGDILVMNCDTPQLRETIIKRCIGTEGDKIKIDYNNNTLEVNGEIMSNEYLGEQMYDKPSFNKTFVVEDGVYEYQVPVGKIFVLGDNRNGSSDSRIVGFIDVEDVLGKVVFRMYPFDTVGVIDSFIK